LLGSTVTDGGRIEETDLYVYGSVTEVGRLMKGETVSGTWARRGWGPVLFD
jgi:hypothetical protein